MMKSIAITRGKQDLLRLIPLNINNNSGDFKIALLNNDYTLRLSQLNTEYFLNVDSDISDYEITYHRSTENQPTKIHFKNIEKENAYKTFPLNNLVDPIINKKIPFPLFEIGISPEDEFKVLIQIKSMHI